MIPYLGIIAFVALILFHELGHYIDAKRQGIFMGFLFSGILAGVKLTTHYKNRFNYLGGLIYSFIPYPAVLYLISIGQLAPIWWLLYIEVAIISAMMDILVFVFFKKSWRNQKFDIIKHSTLNHFLIKGILQNKDGYGVIWVYR